MQERIGRQLSQDRKYDGCGEVEEIPFPYSGSFGWPNNQINRKQIEKRKSNLISCTGAPQIHERDPTYMRDSELEMGIEVYKTF